MFASSFIFLLAAAGFLLLLITTMALSGDGGSKTTSFDSRTTLSRKDARKVYDKFAEKDYSVGGKDVESGYGGPAVMALLEIAEFDEAHKVLEYGCGQGKLAELVCDRRRGINGNLSWRGIDQSPKMIRRFLERNGNGNGDTFIAAELLESGDPDDVGIGDLPLRSYDRFVSTYCLDLLSEEDVYKVLDLAERSLDPQRGKLLLAGITWGYRSSVPTFFTTAIWEFLYRFHRKTVGGCRPQLLQQYLTSKGWRIDKVVKTFPNGYPWMVSEVISARPPLR